ncbi:MAG: hypothetical protein M1814_000707 [Vezdaea aestivalis]|nr:MAG: hypothetical protein M1814_000707 [Vezdaea aestivalis]
MVFKPFSHLARQSFAKSLAYGYAQPLVAASQSSYASTPFGAFNNHLAARSSKSGSLQLHNAFQNHSLSSANAGAKAGHSTSTSNSDAGLAAYYAAWQQHRNGEDDGPWKQFQFPRRLESAHSVAVRDDKKVEIRPALPRHYSLSTVQEGAQSFESPAEESVKEASSSKVDHVDPLPTDSHAYTEDLSSSVSSGKASSGEGSARVDTATPQSSILDSSSSTKPSGTEAFPELPLSTPYDGVVELARAGKYAELPAVFEASLSSGAKPTAEAYHALLAAAINLPASKHQVVVKALDVYFDMLKRGVKPTLQVVTTMMDLLASRSIEASSMTKALLVKRKRFGGLEAKDRALFESSEVEIELLRNDKSLDMAIKIFTSVPALTKALPSQSYGLLIAACAENGRIADMLQFQARMEESKILSSGQIFVSMIEAFGSVGDLRSAVECFNEYKTLAVKHDAGSDTLASRTDEAVYVALTKAYTANGKVGGASRFLAKITELYRSQGIPYDRTQALKDNVIAGAFIQAQIEKGDFKDAFESAKAASLSPQARSRTMASIAIQAADADHIDIASAAFPEEPTENDVAAKAILAAHIRMGNIEGANRYWDILNASPTLNSTDLVEVAAMYTIGHFMAGSFDQVASACGSLFDRIRSSQLDANAKALAHEDIEEALTVIGQRLAQHQIVPSQSAALSMINAMVANSSLVQPLLGHSLMVLGPEIISSLPLPELACVLQAQTHAVNSGVASMSDFARFEHLLASFMYQGGVADKQLAFSINQTLAALPSGVNSTGQFNIAQQWQQYQSPAPSAYSRVETPMSRTGLGSSTFSHFDKAEDPYSQTTDVRGSSVIIDELERNGNKSGSARLNEALTKFKHIRRAGRHPRYITYAKLIAAAARDGRNPLTQELYAIAQTDVPLVANIESVRHGWTLILDAMVGANLTLGDRAGAQQYHQQLLELGSAPSANTFGLYITTLKETARTFDEATEAVKIFMRAKSEGVEPTSFLYNALIGKLGKARRIDDCLLYFAEMRNRGIRPTSVTYGTIVNALCRVSDEKFAEEIFEEMESMPNYKPRPAPYNSLMQFLLTTKRDRVKVLEYFERMQSKHIEPTMHTYKLLIDTYASLEPVDMAAAEGVLTTIRNSGQSPEAVHYSSLIHAKGCVAHDMDGARNLFDSVMDGRLVRPQACLYQALFEAMVANHSVDDTDKVLQSMKSHRVEMTPYIANTLIHGWALKDNITKAKEIYDAAGTSKREPSTYEAMTRAFLTTGDKVSAKAVVREMMTRGYPAAVAGKILELVGG